MNKSYFAGHWLIFTKTDLVRAHVYIVLSLDGTSRDSYGRTQYYISGFIEQSQRSFRRHDVITGAVSVYGDDIYLKKLGMKWLAIH